MRASLILFALVGLLGWLALTHVDRRSRWVPPWLSYLAAMALLMLLTIPMVDDISAALAMPVLVR